MKVEKWTFVVVFVCDDNTIYCSGIDLGWIWQKWSGEFCYWVVCSDTLLWERNFFFFPAERAQATLFFFFLLFREKKKKMLQPKDFVVLLSKKKYIAFFERGSKNWRNNKFVGLSTKYDVTRQFSTGDFQLNFGSFNKVFIPKLTEMPQIYKRTPFLCLL